MSKAHTSIMNATFLLKSGTGEFLVNIGTRTTANSGGGLVTYALFQATTDCVINLTSYGYYNGTYNFRGNIVAIILN